MADEIARIPLDPPRDRVLPHWRVVELTAIVCVENCPSRFNSALGMVPRGFKERCTIPALKAAA